MALVGTYDVLIVGGGVIGLSAARELKRAGVGRIVLIDRGRVGQEASAAAAGMLAPSAEVEEIDDFYRFCKSSLDMYPSFAAELLNETGIDIELDTAGTLYAAFTEADSSALAHRRHTQQRAGLNIVHLSDGETRKAEPFISPDVRESLYYPDDWQVENRKVLAALRRSLELSGVKIIENCEASGLITEGDRVTGAETASGTIAADTTVVATGAWGFNIQTAGLQVPLSVKPIRGQVIAFHTAKRLFQRVIYSTRGYLVPRADGRVLAGATSEDVGFNKSVTEEGIRYLKNAAYEIAPNLANLKIDEAWAGLRPFADDGKPVIGQAGDGIIVATGHYRNGILLAPATARAVADIYAGGDLPGYIKSFGLNRFLAASQPD